MRIAPTRALALVIGAAFGAAVACSPGAPAGGDGSSGAGGFDSSGVGGHGGAAVGGNVCVVRDCDEDAHCADCANGKTRCLVADHRCIACDAKTGGCPGDRRCTEYGSCVPAGLECPVDQLGVPTIACAENVDCLACDPLHQVCDQAAKACVACTKADPTACRGGEVCIVGECTEKCPGACTSDDDCVKCGEAGHEAHACNAHTCGQCSPSYACPGGQVCTQEGVCVDRCGTDGQGTCESDADCAACGGGAEACHRPAAGPGTCGPVAGGCEDLQSGALGLGAPWDGVIAACQADADCAGVSVKLDVGALLRDATGYGGIADGDVDAAMGVCGSVVIGSDGKLTTCGVCVPCKLDADCAPIDVDASAPGIFGKAGTLEAKLLADKVFGDAIHVVQMYCEAVAGDYGRCAPCPGFTYACGVEPPPPGGSCDHDVCVAGSALGADCDACTTSVCAVDPYCCATAWDGTCVVAAQTTCGCTA